MMTGIADVIPFLVDSEIRLVKMLVLCKSALFSC